MFNFRRLAISRLQTLMILVTLWACQSTPMPPTTPLESSPAASLPAELSSPQPTGEIAKIPEPKDESPPPPLNPPISRTLPESIVAAPDRDTVPRQLAYNTSISSRGDQTGNSPDWLFRRNHAGQIVGFEFSNHGGNLILPPRRNPAKNQFFTRDYQFRFDDRARQDIYLLITDWVPSRDRQFRLSELMHSLLHFFPRRVLPAIVGFDGRNIVTLPTGEEVIFNGQTHEISGGVLSEAPVDLAPDRSTRKFPAVNYQGKGVIVRADARGADPRVGTTAIIINGSPLPNCGDGAACRQCRVPARDLWDQSGALRFKFPSDEEFERFLISRCQFGLPRIEAEPTPRS